MTSPVEKSDGKITVTTGIEEVAPDLFVINGLFSVFGLSLPHRMTVIRVPETQDLIVYSPFCPTMVDVTSLGTVKAVIAPNAMHDTHAQSFVEAHLGSTLYSSPSLPKKYPNRDWGTILNGSTREDLLSDQVRVRVLTELKGLQEVVLLHVPTNTLIVADLAFNYSQTLLESMKPGVRFLLHVLRATQPLNWSLTAKLIMRSSCKGLLPQLDSLLNDWEWDRYVLCHGEIVQEDAKTLFRNGIYKWVKSVASGDQSLWVGVIVTIAAAVAVGYTVRKNPNNDA